MGWRRRIRAHEAVYCGSLFLQNPRIVCAKHAGSECFLCFAASTDSDQPTTTAYPATPHPNAGVGPTQQDSSESEAGSLESAEVVEERAEVEAKGTRPPRKPLQPFDVPTSGAFYMHDDRNGSEEEAPRCESALDLPFNLSASMQSEKEALFFTHDTEQNCG